MSGNIVLSSILGIDNGLVSIEGGSAPNGGICLKGFGVQVNASDVVIQHLRIRPGTNAAPSNNDGLSITTSSRRVVIDHCSLSWAQDENLSIYGQDITISNCIISEGLSNSGHPDGEHSMGCFWTGATATRISFHHNFLAHNTNRNPVSALGLSDCINNVLYNGRNPAICEPAGGNIQMNFIKNWQKEGANSLQADQANLRLMQNEWTNTQQAYVEGNYGPRRPLGTEPENNCVFVSEQGYLVGSRFAYTGSHSVTETSAADAKTAVLAGAGATLPKRDSVDARVVADVDAGTGAIIDDPTDVGGWPDLTV